MIPNIGYTNKTADDFYKIQRRRQITVILWAIFLSAAFTGVLIRLNGNVIVPVGVMLGLILLGLIWQFPRTLYFVMLAGSCLVETYPLKFKDSVTDAIPLFWDVNTVVQTYLKITNFHGVAFSFFEILLILAGVSWLIRGVFNHTITARGGTLLIPIVLYVCFVFVGLINGLATGGKFNIALFEVRAQVYFLLAYLMAVNMSGEEHRRISTLFWISAIAIGLKGILASFRFVFTLKGVTIPEIGIGAHEESFFFNCFVFELIVLKLADVEPKLRRLMIFMLPFVVLANLANERRAATAAMVLAMLIMFVLAAVAFPKRRKAIAITTIIIAAIAAVYLPLYWNKTGTLAQPARAIKSQFSPDERDQSSNEYRDAENANLMETLKTSPIIGYGYGKAILLDTPMVDLTDIDPLIHYMTHNQILWVWMRVGTIGFFCFWVMITSLIMQGCQILKNPNATPEAKAAALAGILIIVMQMVFGLLDLQISNVRNMLFCGLWAGAIGMFRLQYSEAADLEAEVLSSSGRISNAPRWKLPAPEQQQS